jgi:hypothetical protein
LRYATYPEHIEDCQRRHQDDVDEGVAIEDHVRDRDLHDRRIEQDENDRPDVVQDGAVGHNIVPPLQADQGGDDDGGDDDDGDEDNDEDEEEEEEVVVAPQVVIPLARCPYQEPLSHHNVGSLDVACPHYGALHFIGE